MRETASQFAGASLQRVTIQDNADISMTIEFYSAGNDERCGPRRFHIAVSMAFASSQIEPATVAVYRGNGSTCSEFIYSLRLDHAARLLHRRASLGTGQPLSEIAYACGFRDYTHFARKFRRQFGYAPGAHSGAHHRASGLIRVNTGKSALSAPDV